LGYERPSTNQRETKSVLVTDWRDLVDHSCSPGKRTQNQVKKPALSYSEMIFNCPTANPAPWWSENSFDKLAAED
jgi:hypothetical protein